MVWLYPFLTCLLFPTIMTARLVADEVVTKDSQQWMQWSSCRSIGDWKPKKEKQEFLKENLMLFCPSCPRSRLELLFFRTAPSIQVQDSVYRLHLHRKMNESDTITTYQEVLCDVTFPWSNLLLGGCALFLELLWVILKSIQQDETCLPAEGQPAAGSWLLFSVKSGEAQRTEHCYTCIFPSLKTPVISSHYPKPPSWRLKFCGQYCGHRDLQTFRKTLGKQIRYSNKKHFPER